MICFLKSHWFLCFCVINPIEFGRICANLFGLNLII